MFEDDVPDAASRAGVHASGGLVQDHQPRAADESDGDRELPLHATGQRPHPLVTVRVHPCLLQNPAVIEDMFLIRVFEANLRQILKGLRTCALAAAIPACSSGGL